MYRVTIEKPLLRKLQKQERRVLKMLDEFLEKLGKTENPRSMGKALSGNLAGFWRYRLGDYRLLCDIQDETVTIVAFEFDHRSKVYKLKSLSKYGRSGRGQKR